MKKIGLLIFIITILVGVVFANLFSFGRASGQLFNFSFSSGIKGSGVAATEAREINDFTGVDVGGVFQVEITAGKDFSVSVDADDNLLQYIKTEVNGDVLHIETTERINSTTPIRVHIAAPDIESLSTSGASKVALAGVRNSSLEVDTSGASKIKIEGQTGDLKVGVSGASSVDAGSLKAQSASVDASGAGSVSVFATERLVSEASGASNITYSGNPTNVEKKSSGASRIHQK
jgi:hypothetical protein